MPPTPPTTPPNTPAIDTGAVDAANQLNFFDTVLGAVQTGLSNFSTGLQDVSAYFKENTNFTQQNVNALLLLSSAVMGASKSFESLRAAADQAGLESIAGQFQIIIETASKTGTAFADLTKIASGLGVPIDKSLTALSRSAPATAVGVLKDLLLGAAKNIGLATDAALRFQQAYTQMMLSSGQSTELFRQAGTNLENLNNLMQNQGRLITSVYAATGVALPTLTTFYNTLGKNIPGSLEQMVPAVGKASGSVSLFQAAIELAHGTGKSLEEVNKDLATAFMVLGKEGQNALEFIGRMSELSERFKIPISETTGFVNHAADSFKMLGDNTKGVTQIFTDFFGTLREGGLGIKPSIDIINQVSDSISHMTVAQRAFISSRTGGPGGLLGSIQMERQLRTDPNAASDIFNKMREAFLQQVGGRVITQDQVQTQGQAAQFERQRQLLQSGAFGGMAANEDQATRILEVLAKPPTADNVKEQTKLLNELRTRGSTIENQSLTELRQINAKAEYLKMLGGLKGLQLMQEGFGIQGENADRLAMARGAAGNEGAQAAAGKYDDNQNTRDAFSGMADSVGGAVKSLDAGYKAANQMLGRSQSAQQIIDDNKKNYEMFFKEMEDKRKRIESVPQGAISEERRAAMLAKIDAEEAALATVRARGSAGMRGRAVGEQAGAKAHASNQAARAGHATPPAYAPGGQNVHVPPTVVNVYINGKKQTGLQVTHDTAGAPGVSGHDPGY